MKVGLFSDLHGNQYAFRAFIDKIKQLNLDAFIFCGDIFGYYYGQEEILETLTKINNMVWILGNHDRYFLELLNGRRSLLSLTAQYGNSYFLAKEKLGNRFSKILNNLAPTKEIERLGIKINISHGTPEEPDNGRFYPKDAVENLWLPPVDIVIMGHTHFRMKMQYKNRLIINPGSLGQPRDKNPSGFAILTLPEKEVEFVDIEYNRKLLESEVLKIDPGNKKLIDILYRADQKQGD